MSLVSPVTPLLLQRTRLQVRARESLDCLRDVSLKLPSAAVHAGGGGGCGDGKVDLLEVPASNVFGNSADAAAPETAAHATAGESKGILGLRVSASSLRMPINSSNSSGSVDVVARARVSAVPGVSATVSSSASATASLAVVAHARSTPMHVAHNSDTGRVQGPREGGVPKVGFPLWLKICALSQRWRQG